MVFAALIPAHVKPANGLTPRALSAAVSLVEVVSSKLKYVYLSGRMERQRIAPNCARIAPNCAELRGIARNCAPHLVPLEHDLLEVGGLDAEVELLIHLALPRLHHRVEGGEAAVDPRDQLGDPPRRHHVATHQRVDALVLHLHHHRRAAVAHAGDVHLRHRRRRDRCVRKLGEEVGDAAAALVRGRRRRRSGGGTPMRILIGRWNSWINSVYSETNLSIFV